MRLSGFSGTRYVICASLQVALVLLLVFSAVKWEYKMFSESNIVSKSVSKFWYHNNDVLIFSSQRFASAAADLMQRLTAALWKFDVHVHVHLHVHLHAHIHVLWLRLGDTQDVKSFVFVRWL